MKEKILLFLLISIPSVIFAQMQKERRVYYLDCSYSMVTNNIWEPVCESLISAIDKVEDNTTSLWVIPFAVDGVHHETLTPITATADDTGKNQLKNAISAIIPSRSSKTYHSDPMKDFYNNGRVASGDTITYLFFMTDGQNEEEAPYNFESELAKWTKYSNSQVYGFYVMLHESAYNTKIENQIDELPHFWNVHSADVNINLARVPNSGVFNIRNEEYLELPITGNCNGYKISSSFDDINAPYEVKRTVINGKSLRVYISKKEGAIVPENVSLNLILSCENEKELEKSFMFWLTDRVKVVCLDKKERTLKINVR